jgi:hypothetical protein
MRPRRFTCLILVGFVLGASAAAPSVELPGYYFKLMEAELKPLQPDNLKSNHGAMLAAAVLYTKKHPANPSLGDKQKLDLALKLGDLFADQSEKDTAENKQDYEWEIHFWLDTFRLLETQLGNERRARWQREIE